VFGEREKILMGKAITRGGRFPARVWSQKSEKGGDAGRRGKKGSTNGGRVFREEDLK